MSLVSFDELYNALNTEQKRAVDTIEGPVMVIAGPGTGKTQILTLRIANILKKTDVGPDAILALTFTESGAFNMRKRLATIIGSTAYKINIFTFHGFCNEIIKTYPEAFSRIIGANNITDIDQIRLMEDIIVNSSLPRLKPYGDPLYYIKPVLSQIKNLKREDINPAQFEKIIKDQEAYFKAIDDLYYNKGQHKGKMKGKYKDLEKDIEKNKDLLTIYTQYEEKLQEGRLFDFDDMIMEVVRILKSDEDLLLRLQEKYQYILADEHQDANQGQNHILELLSGFFESPNLFIVGDEKQAIYRFQGASLENFLYFKKLYPQAVLINLVHNYRSTQSILDSAHSLISKNKIADETLHKELQSHSTHVPSKIKVYPFSEARHEYLFLASDIEKKIQAGIPAQEICVLFRDNKDVFPIIKVLEKTTIPFSVESGQNILEDEEIIKLLKILKTVNEVGNTELLSEFLFIDFLKFDYLDVYKILTFARKEKKSLYDVIQSEKNLTDAKIEHTDIFLKLYTTLSQWSAMSKNKNCVDCFEIVVRESGFLNHVLSLPGSLDTISKLELLFNEIKKVAGNHKNYRLSDLIMYLNSLEEHGVFIKIDSTGNTTKGVRLMTAHKSKGLEFEYVYIVGVSDGHWGNKRTISHFSIPLQHIQKDTFDPIDDERRLFYVALTRARKEVSITWSKESLSKKEQLPSQFIEEIGESLVEKIDTGAFEKSVGSDLLSLFAPKNNYGADIKDIHYLQQLFLEQGLSVTALNNYLRCPWNYFFENLIRIPRPQSKHQLYGTSVHEVLTLFFEKYKKEEDLTKEAFLTFFEDFLQRKPFEQRDYEESLEKGKRALGGYYDTYKNSWSRNIFTNFKITGIEIHFQGEDSSSHSLVLRGELDKIELEEGNRVTVVDYKTRKPLSRNELEGKTKNSTGDYKRQLVFYKLLLDQYDTTKFSMQRGIIDFIEPDDNGTYKKEIFEITNEEVNELQELIKKTANSIYTLDFWDSHCDEPECHYCSLRKVMKK